MITLQRLIGTALAALLIQSMPIAHAQSNYPQKPIHMIIPLAAGSAVDKAIRIVSQKMAESLGQPIVIENLPGSSGMIGADRVAKAQPDGYTLGGFNDSILTMIPHIYPKMPWSALDDFAPVSLVTTVEWGLVVPANSPYKTVKDFIDAVRAAPGKINYSSGGNGSPQHVAMALFASRAGLDLTHVPYKGATPAAVAVAANEVDAAFQGLGTVAGLIQSGKVRLLAVSTREPMKQFPGIPTVHESGLADFYFDSWSVIVAPAGTPADIISRLNQAVVKALASPDVQTQLAPLGMTLRGTSAAALGEATRKNFEMYQQLMRSNGIQAN